MAFYQESTNNIHESLCQFRTKLGFTCFAVVGATDTCFAVVGITGACFAFVDATGACGELQCRSLLCRLVGKCDGFHK